MGLLDTVTNILTGGASGAADDAANAARDADRLQRDFFSGSAQLAAPQIGFENAARSQLANLLGFNFGPAQLPAAFGGGTGPPSSPNLGAFRGTGAPGRFGEPGLPPNFGGSGSGFATPGINPAAPDPLAALRNTPGHQFGVDEALRAVSTAGPLEDGSTLDALLRTGFGLADQTFNNRVAQLTSAANQGAGAANLGQQGLGVGSRLGDIAFERGNAQGAGNIAKFSSLGNLINGGISAIFGGGGFGG